MAINGYFDIGLSFAGEYREEVLSTKIELEKLGYSVFYDKDHQKELIGEELYKVFQDIYERRCSLCVMFVSKEYVKRSYPSFERKIIENRLKSEKGLRIALPFVMDKKSNEHLENLGRHTFTNPEEVAHIIDEIFKSEICRRLSISRQKISDLMIDDIVRQLRIKGFAATQDKGRIVLNTNNNVSDIIIKPNWEYGNNTIDVYSVEHDCLLKDSSIPDCIIFINDLNVKSYYVRFLIDAQHQPEEPLLFNKMTFAITDWIIDQWEKRYP